MKLNWHYYKVIKLNEQKYYKTFIENYTLSLLLPTSLTAVTAFTSLTAVTAFTSLTTVMALLFQSYILLLLLFPVFLLLATSFTAVTALTSLNAASSSVFVPLSNMWTVQTFMG